VDAGPQAATPQQSASASPAAAAFAIFLCIIVMPFQAGPRDWSGSLLALMSGGCPARSRVGLRLRFRLCSGGTLRAAWRRWQERCDKGGGEPVLVCGLSPASADDEGEVVARADVSGPGSEGRDGSYSERSGGYDDDEHRGGGPAPGWLVATGRCAGHVGVVPVLRVGDGRALAGGDTGDRGGDLGPRAWRRPRG
jgi:hypothetical protein